MANNLKTVGLMALLGAISVGAGWFFFGSQGALIALAWWVIWGFRDDSRYPGSA